MIIDFTKVVASGNDFIIVDNRKSGLAQKITDFGNFTKFCSRRKYSVGADGLLVLENSETGDFKMRIFNPDGTEVEMCGNGIRSSALYAYTKKWCGSSMKIETRAGVLETEIKGETVKVKMTSPNNIKLDRNIGTGKTIMNVHSVNTGVPHVVHFVKDAGNYPVREMGAKIRYHKLFEPEGTNADFVEVIDKSTILVRTYERGVENETLACGTGVVASAIISHLVNGTEMPVRAITKSEDVLKVYFEKEGNYFRDVYLEGNAHILYEGEVYYV